MCGAGVLLVGRSPADVAVDDDQGGSIVGLLEHVQGPLQEVEVVRVTDPDHVPAVADESRRHVVGVGQFGVSLDGDVVVVVDPAEVGQLEVAGKGGRLAADPLHEAAIAADRIDVEVEELEVGTVEVLGHPAGGHRHPHRGRDPLTEGTGGGLHPGGPPVLGMTRALAAELAEVPDVVEAHRGFADDLVLRVHRLHPAQVEEGVEEHGGVAVAEDEPVPVRPDGIGGVEVHHVLPERVGHGGERHRGPGVT